MLKSLSKFALPLLAVATLLSLWYVVSGLKTIDNLSKKIGSYEAERKILLADNEKLRQDSVASAKDAAKAMAEADKLKEQSKVTVGRLAEANQTVAELRKVIVTGVDKDDLIANLRKQIDLERSASDAAYKLLEQDRNDGWEAATKFRQSASDYKLAYESTARAYENEKALRIASEKIGAVLINKLKFSKLYGRITTVGVVVLGGIAVAKVAGI